MQQLSESLAAWLRAFSLAVRERDFAAGRKLFHENVQAFGTICRRANSLEDLALNQWQNVWPHTRGFDFDYASALAIREANQAIVAADWSSVGLAVDGARFSRRGRATIVLQQMDSEWKAVHTHFSLDPQ